MTSAEEEAIRRKQARSHNRPLRRRGSRKTYLLDALRLDTTHGLPPPIRARLLLLAYYEKSRLVWRKITKLIKPMIKTGMAQSKAEVFRVLTGEKMKAVTPYIAIVRPKEITADKLAGDYILEWGGHRRYSSGPVPWERDGFSLRHNPSLQDVRLSCYMINPDKPANSSEELVVRLVARTQKHQLNSILYLLAVKADGKRPGEKRSYGKWLLRDRKGKARLLIDDSEGLRLETLDEILL